MSGPSVFVGERRIARNLCLEEIEGPMWVDGMLVIEDCPLLMALPKHLKVNGDLEIRNCPAFRSLPRQLEVRGDLILENLNYPLPEGNQWEVGGTIKVS